MEDKPKHGGKRKGSGRKKGVEKAQITLKLDKSLFDDIALKYSVKHRNQLLIEFLKSIAEKPLN